MNMIARNAAAILLIFTASLTICIAREGAAGTELIQANRAIRARVAENHQRILHDADFHRFAHVVAAVVHGVDHRFLDGCIGNIVGSPQVLVGA